MGVLNTAKCLQLLKKNSVLFSQYQKILSFLQSVTDAVHLEQFCYKTFSAD